MNKPVFLGQPILDQGEILMYELTTCKPKYRKKGKSVPYGTRNICVWKRDKKFLPKTKGDVKTKFDKCGYSKDNKSMMK